MPSLATLSCGLTGTHSATGIDRNTSARPPSTFHRALSDLVESADLVNMGTDKRPFYKAAS